MSWGKGDAYPLYGDKVRVHPRKHDRFDDGIWEICSSSRSNMLIHYELVPWPHDRIEWPSLARQWIWAYPHDLIKLNALELLAIAL